jgi:hypothetical protein
MVLIKHDYSVGKKKLTMDESLGNDIIFLVWSRNGVRADNFSKYLRACLYFLFSSPLRHPTLIVTTINILLKERPKVIICQSPPMTCALTALVYRILFARRSRPKIILDAHRGAFYRPWSYIKFLSNFILRRADLVIVEDVEIQNLVLDHYGIKSRILEDPIPKLEDLLYDYRNQNKICSNKSDVAKPFKVAVINPYTWDVPLRQIIEAAAALVSIADFYLTGDIKNANSELLKDRTNNIILTGFLPAKEYISLIVEVDAILALVNDPLAMQASGYEAVAAEKILITSNHPPLKRYFTKGTIHVKNSAQDIKEAIIMARDKEDMLKKEMHELRLEKQKEWKEKITNLLRTINIEI